MNLKEQILKATLDVYNKKGLKFTMDDVAKKLGISKKTIYTVFRDKVSLINEMVDYCFDKIKKAEQEIVSDDQLMLTEKIRGILSVLPDSYKEMDLTGLYVLKDKYPKTYRMVEARLENGWETTIGLLEEGIKEGVIRPISIPLFKLIYESTLEAFFRRDVLVKNKMSYDQALKAVVDILMKGIETNE